MFFKSGLVEKPTAERNVGVTCGGFFELVLLLTRNEKIREYPVCGYKAIADLEAIRKWNFFLAPY